MIDKVRSDLHLNRYDTGLLRNIYAPEAWQQDRSTRRYRQDGELDPSKYPTGPASEVDTDDAYEYLVRIRPTRGNSDGASGDTLHVERSRVPLTRDELDEVIRGRIADGMIAKGSEGEGDILEDGENIDIEVIRIYRIPGQRRR